MKKTYKFNLWEMKQIVKHLIKEDKEELAPKANTPEAWKHIQSEINIHLKPNQKMLSDEMIDHMTQEYGFTAEKIKNEIKKVVAKRGK